MHKNRLFIATVLSTLVCGNTFAVSWEEATASGREMTAVDYAQRLVALHPHKVTTIRNTAAQYNHISLTVAQAQNVFINSYIQKFSIDELQQLWTLCDTQAVQRSSDYLRVDLLPKLAIVAFRGEAIAGAPVTVADQSSAHDLQRLGNWIVEGVVQHSKAAFLPDSPQVMQQIEGRRALIRTEALKKIRRDFTSQELNQLAAWYNSPLKDRLEDVNSDLMALAVQGNEAQLLQDYSFLRG
jgi:hypothetical protein